MSWFKHTTSIVAAASLIGLSAQAVTFAEETGGLPNKEVQCLAKNIYFEAKNQGTGGWLAVAFVTLNRVKDTRYPNTICEVVYQGPSKPSWQDPKKQIPIRHKCQFSWFCDGRPDDIRNKSKYTDILIFTNLMLDQAISTDMIDITDGATHYHADYVKPAWAKTKTKTIEIGDHIFYRWEK
jgi:spore germination cell wall hydrolase CwlJ-like protein